ncbi:uncharacterized protein [Miscanthus floridulus]|uniref:uncharacterized protein n=1 Tax=Miscanthus floridulus TaxID=154761 RepID=UPI00345870D3
MARRLLVALLAVSLLLARPNSTSSPPATAAYDELHLRGFPRGLLPTNACAYTFDVGSTHFAVDLRSSYRIVLPAGGYLAAFSERLTGCLDDRRISGLDGIRVRAFFRWWSITGTDNLLSLKRMFQVFQLFQRYVARVSYGYCKSRLGCCLCCNGCTLMLQTFVPNVLYILFRQQHNTWYCAIPSHDFDERRRHVGLTAREPTSSLYFLRFARSLERSARSPSPARVLPFARSRSLP